MKKYVNLVILNKDRTGVLMCIRKKAPYEGKYNVVGGKYEESDEGSWEAAGYRELFEETGLTREDVTLTLSHTVMYNEQSIVLDYVTGVLKDDVELREEDQKLYWLSALSDFSGDVFAGDGDLVHAVRMALNNNRLTL